MWKTTYSAISIGKEQLIDLAMLSSIINLVSSSKWKWEFVPSAIIYWQLHITGFLRGLPHDAIYTLEEVIVVLLIRNCINFTKYPYFPAYCMELYIQGRGQGFIHCFDDYFSLCELLFEKTKSCMLWSWGWVWSPPPKELMIKRTCSYYSIIMSKDVIYSFVSIYSHIHDSSCNVIVQLRLFQWQHLTELPYNTCILQIPHCIFFEQVKQ